MKLLAYQDLVAAPWKNGGGVTRELCCWPEQSSFDDFAWRVSIADVHRSGPFSVFPGIDRVITLLDGDGMQLRFENGSTHALTQTLTPYRFKGEDKLDAQLVDKTSHDFNLMLRRDCACGDVEIRREAGTIPEGLIDGRTALLLFSASGHWQATAGNNHEKMLKPNDALLIENHVSPVTVVPTDADSALLCVRVSLLQ